MADEGIKIPVEFDAARAITAIDAMGTALTRLEGSVTRSAQASAASTEALKATADALARMADATEKSGDAVEKTNRKTSDFLKTLTGASSVGSVTTATLGGLSAAFGQVTGSIEGAVRLGEAWAQSAAAGDQELRALQALGPAYDRIRAATNDTLTASAAYRAEQTLLRSGLHLTGDEFATIARYAREHGDVTQTVEQRVESLSEAMRRGTQRGLQRWGLEVEHGSTRAHAFNRALGEMQHAEEGTQPAARTMTEDVSRLGSSLTEGANALSLMGARALGMQGILSDTSDLIRTMTEDVLGLVDAESHVPQQQAREQARQAARSRYIAEVHAAGQLADMVGGDRRLLPSLESSGNLTAEQYTAAAAALHHAQEVGSRSGNISTVSNAFNAALRDASHTIDTDSSANARAAVTPPPTGPRDTAPADRVASGGGARRAGAEWVREFRESLEHETQDPRFVDLMASGGLTPEGMAQVRSHIARNAHESVALWHTRQQAEVDRFQVMGRTQTEHRQDRDWRTEDREDTGTFRDLTAGTSALTTAASGGQLAPSQQRAIGQRDTMIEAANSALDREVMRLAQVNQLLVAGNLTSQRRNELVQRRDTLTQELATHEDALAAVGAQHASAERARLEAESSAASSQVSLINAARTAQRDGLTLTNSQTDALMHQADTARHLKGVYVELAASLRTEEDAARHANTPAEREGHARNAERIRAEMAQNEESRKSLGANSEAARVDAARVAHTRELTGALTDSARAMAQSSAAALVHGDLTAKGLKTELHAQLQALETKAIVKAAEWTAQGISDLAGVYTAELAPGDFAAAAEWASVAALAAGGSAATKSKSSPASSGGGSASAPTSAAPAGSGSSPRGGSGQGNTTVHIYVTGALASDEATLGNHVANWLNAGNKSLGTTISPKAVG